DDRKKKIRLVKKDPDFEEKYQSIAKDMNQVFYKGISEENILQFEKTLERVLENLIKASKG
ncbi:MAG: MarR family transcriptional regulator, partial [Candidatus Hodarchaeota archaeon]